MSIDLEAIEARANAATPGPWMWDVRENYKQVKLVTEHSGQYYVMDFERWGMQGACPSFQVYDKYDGPVRERGSHGMMRADQLAKSYPGKEHHKGFDDYIDHPDAIFIAHAPEDIKALLALVKQQAEQLAAVTAERDAAANAVAKMAEYIVTLGGVDYHLCDVIPQEHHLKFQPKNDGDYDNEPCIECVKAYFMSEAGKEQKHG